MFRLCNLTGSLLIITPLSFTHRQPNMAAKNVSERSNIWWELNSELELMCSYMKRLWILRSLRLLFDLRSQCLPCSAMNLSRSTKSNRVIWWNWITHRSNQPQDYCFSLRAFCSVVDKIKNVFSSYRFERKEKRAHFIFTFKLSHCYHAPATK